MISIFIMNWYGSILHRLTMQFINSYFHAIVYIHPNCKGFVLIYSTELVDEEECSRRRNECLDDMIELEKQFSDIREQYVCF